MNWIVRQIDEFTMWMILTHNSRMRRLRADLERRERNRRINTRRHEQRGRKAQRRVREASSQMVQRQNRELLDGLRDVRDYMSSQRRRD